MIELPITEEELIAARWHGDMLTCDPSVRSPGASLFRHGVLIACTRIKVDPATYDLPFGQRCVRVAQEIASWWMDQENTTTVRTLVYELPQIYTTAKSKGDHNDLLGLVGVGQGLAVLLHAHALQSGARPPELLTPTPFQWTGDLPKTIKVRGKNVLPKHPKDSPRGARVQTRLTPGELAVVPPSHDAYDSAGLGLFALGRWKQIRRLAGCV